MTDTDFPKPHVHWTLKAALVVTFLLHLVAARNPFFMDDFAYLETAMDLGWSNIPSLFTSGNLDQSASGVWWTPGGMLPFFRPIAILSFALDWQIWGLNAFGFHATNVLLHGLCTVLVWRFVRRVSRDDAVAAVGALLFASHPVHNEAVLWMSGRFDLMVCAAGLSSILAYLRWRDGGRSGWAVVSLLLYVVALGCKENGIVVPAVWFVLALFWKDARGERSRLGEWLMGIAFAVIGIAYVGLRFALFGGLGSLPPPYGVDLSTRAGFVELFRNLTQYILDFVLMIQADAVLMSSFWTRHPWLMMASLLVAIVVFLWVARSGRSGGLVLLGVAWVAIFTAPTLPAMPGERNVYFASAGLALIFGPAIARWFRDATMRKLAVAIVTWAVVLSAGEHYLLHRTNSAAQQVYDDLKAHLPDPPENARIYVVNQNPFTSIGFSSAARIMYGRDDVHAMALTVAQDTKADTQDHAERVGPNRLQVTRTGGPFFSGFFERLLLFGNQPADLPGAAESVGLKVSFDWENYENADAMTIELPVSINDEITYLYRWDNGHVRSLYDALWRANLPRLVPLELASSPSDAD